MKNAYEVYGLSLDFDRDTLEDLHRSKSKRYHPDRPDGDAEMFRMFQEAYEILSDDSLRYDARKAEEKRLSAKFSSNNSPQNTYQAPPPQQVYYDEPPQHTNYDEPPQRTYSRVLHTAGLLTATAIWGFSIYSSNVFYSVSETLLWSVFWATMMLGTLFLTFPLSYKAAAYTYSRTTSPLPMVFFYGVVGLVLAVLQWAGLVLAIIYYLYTHPTVRSKILGWKFLRRRR